MTKSESDFKDMIDIYDEEPTPVEDGPKRPHEYDPGWSEYILDNMSDNELIQGAPTVDGLRRATEKCFGEILQSKSEIVEVPTRQNNKCTIRHSLVIRKYSTESVIEVDGCVDVLYDKIPYPFNTHLVATADTRAEGKALRRALKIRGVTAEELQNQDEDDVMASEEGMNDQQILALNQMCKRLNISVVKFVKSQYNEVKVINDVSNMEARVLIGQLSGFQRKPKSIEKKIKGYDDNWKCDFYRGSS